MSQTHQPTGPEPVQPEPDSPGGEEIPDGDAPLEMPVAKAGRGG